MEYRPLHITLISAEGLKDVKLFRFSKMDVYAEVSIVGYPQSKRKTRVDKNCGSNPKWNDAHMEFMVDEPYLSKPGLSLLFQLKAQSSISSDKEVGSATVPVHDLFNPDSAQDKFIEYQLHTPSGKPKGSLKFSYRFGDKFTQQVEAKQHAPEPVTAYPAAPPPPYAAGGSPYPPAGPYQGMAYPPPPAAYGAYPSQTSWYGYHQAPPPQGYGYPLAPAVYAPPYGQPQKPKKNKMGMGGGLGLGLGAGLLGGLLVGEMASDIGDGYDDAMGGGFDF